jgi:hypothetical protein
LTSIITTNTPRDIIAVFKMVEIDVDHATQKTHNKNTNDQQSRDI